MTFVDDIRAYVDSAFLSSDDPVFQIINYVLAGIIFAILGVGLFIVIRFLLGLSERPPGRYLHLYKFAGVVNESGERTSIIGHLSFDNEIFSPNMIQTLKRITDIEKEYPEVVKLAQSQKVFFYNFNLKESEKSGVFKENKKSIIISPVDLDDRDNYWEDQRGEFSLTANGFKIFPRTVDCFKTCDYKELSDPHGKSIDVYRLAVIPQTLKKIEKAISEEEFVMQVADFPADISAEILGTLKLYLPALVESWQRIEPAEKEAERLRNLNQKLRNDLATTERVHEPTKHRALLKSIVGHADAQTPKQLGVAWGWRLGYFIAGIVGFTVIPQINFLAWLTPYGGAFVGLVGILLVNYIIETKNKPTTDRPQEANEAEVN